MKVMGGILIGILIGILALPLWRITLVKFNQDRYGELTYLCDSAMRTHNLAKARVSVPSTADKIQDLKQSEISLIICQDYDLMQKKLMNWGLRENELAYMRLQSIEASSDGLKEVIDSHEIRN